ncbi:MAG: histidine kinase [Acidobacteriota bacterium]|nr:histidine kinase [Acidobacteriota bacterium]
MTSGEFFTQPRKIHWWHFAAGFAVWTLIGLSFATRSYLGLIKQGANVSWQNLAISYMIDFYLWGLVSPFIFRLCHRFPIERERLATRISLFLILSLVFTFIIIAVSIPIYWYLGSPDLFKNPTFASFFSQSIISPVMIHENLVIFWATVAVAHAFEYYRRSRDREMQAAQLAAQSARLSEQLVQAQLSALKMQLHPHFLFNTLNSIASLLHKDTETAHRMIARLSDFLRMTLKNSEMQSVSLEKELEFLNTYLEIEKIRFQDRLVIEMQVEPEAFKAQVPNLILQPIVENAVQHGLANVTATGHLKVSAHRINGKVHIQIEDNGPGLNANGNRRRKGKTSNGVGLANTRARLEQFYSENFSFEIADKPESRGTIVSLQLPFKS